MLQLTLVRTRLRSAPDGPLHLRSLLATSNDSMVESRLFPIALMQESLGSIAMIIEHDDDRCMLLADQTR